MSLITAQLRGIAERHPLDEKILVTAGAGTAQEAVTLRDRLAAEGTPWIGFREATVSDLAGRLAGPRLAEAGLRPVPSTVQLFLVQELAEEHLLGGTDGYFSELESTAAVLRSARSALEDLRGAGLGPEDLDPGAFAAPEKGRALRRLLEAYLERLESDGWVDGAGVIGRAMEAIDAGEAAPTPVLCVLGDAPLSALEARLLERWPAGERLLVGPGAANGTEAGPGRAAARLEGFRRADPVPETAGPHPAGRLFRSGAGEEGPEERLDLRLAVGAENEVRAALRTAARRGLPLDRVEIVYTDGDRYRDLVRSEAEGLDVRCTFAEGLPVKLTRPGQALRLFYDWILEDFDDRVLRRLLRSGLVDLRRAEGPGAPEEGGLLPGQAAALLREAKVGSGRGRYGQALERLRRGLEGRRDERVAEGRSAGTLEQRLTLLAELEALVHPDGGRLWELVPGPGEVQVAEMARASVRFLREYAVHHGELEPPAHESLGRRLQEVAEEVAATLPRGRAVRLLRDEIELHPISRSGPRPGCLHVAPLESGGLTGRELTAVVGLDESRFPGTGIEDPFLLDRERERLSDELPLRGRRPSERVRDLARALGEAGGDVLLTSSVMEIADDRELYPASAFLRAFRVSVGDPRAGFEACLEALQPPASFVPEEDDEALDESAGWLSRRRGPGYAEAVRETQPLLAAGHRAERARASSAFTEWDGWVPSAEGGAEDPRRTGAVVSASRLETLLESPYRYFLRYVLELEPVEELDYEPGQWLDPMERGRLLHQVYRRFMERVSERGERPDESRHAGELEVVLEELVARRRREIPPPSDGAFRRELRELRRSAAVFLRDEADRAREAEGAGFEVRFGFGDEGGVLGSPDPVAVEVGPAGTLRLRGSIDRVDRRADGSYRVWDYKTGGTSRYSRAAPLQEGHLQWLLYGLALEELLAAAGRSGGVSTGGYLFPTTRGHGQRFAYRITPARVQEAGELLERHLGLAAAGLFPHTTEEDHCRYCDYREVCGDPERRAAQMKAILGRLEAPGEADPDELAERLGRWSDG